MGMVLPQGRPYGVISGPLRRILSCPVINANPLSRGEVAALSIRWVGSWGDRVPMVRIQEFRLVLALAQQVAGIGSQVAIPIQPPGGPAHFHDLDPAARPEAEMEARIACGLVAAAADAPGLL